MASGLQRQLVYAALLCLAAGCGKSTFPRAEVRGTVLYHGQPIREGQIRFIPQTSNGGPISLATITDGHYDYADRGGVPLGSHRVEIRAWDPSAPQSRGPGGAARPQLLPPKYNDKSDLSWELEVGAGPVTKDFALD